MLNDELLKQYVIAQEQIAIVTIINIITLIFNFFFEN